MSEPSLAGLFPREGGIPEDHRFPPTDAGLTLLLGGSVTRWGGASAPVLSAVCVRKESGALEPVGLGPGALASADAARACLEAAVAAWKGGRGEWPRASTAERVAAIRRFVEKVRPLRESVARSLMWEVGKPWKDSLVEFDRTMAYIEETAEALLAMERAAATPLSAGGFAARIRRAPLGVTLCMGPYNYALNEVFTLVIPALVMGNPVIIKTPRYGVLSNTLLVPALAACFPKGVVSLLTGDGASVVGPLMESGKVDVLAFIGSQRVAGILLRQHPRPYRLRWVLGMGAKNPAIVLADADLDHAAREIAAGALTFGGQRCTALKHVLVERKVAGALVERLSSEIGKLKAGMPWEDGVTVTPLPDPKHPAWLTSLVEDAVSKGARVVNPEGGASAATLYRPALVYPVSSDAQLFTVEQFGPIVPVSVVGSPEDALDVLEASEVGQQASVFGRDPAVIGPLVDHLANLVCRVNLNTQCRRGPDVFPFTGRKDSAVGTLSITDALRVFSIRSLVAAPEKARGDLEALGATSRFLSLPEPGT